jgi:hypothetical protein
MKPLKAEPFAYVLLAAAARAYYANPAMRDDAAAFATMLLASVEFDPALMGAETARFAKEMETNINTTHDNAQTIIH